MYIAYDSKNMILVGKRAMVVVTAEKIDGPNVTVRCEKDGPSFVVPFTKIVPLIEQSEQNR